MQIYQCWVVVERNGKFCVQHPEHEETYCFDTREFANLHCNFCNRVDRINYEKQIISLSSTSSLAEIGYGSSCRFYWTINRNSGFRVFVNEKPSPFVCFFQKHLLGIEYFPV